ncbi:hypothetical protein FA13DRAFT_1787317 [Coprinellus micaceus]|uniref:F-box domain-containing protein n=1 Tax=Coprinellus micaceus TaxID=71717 RepID=A0A4Y7TT12_COPMI|nr:hypothetical protein FA13DRAFT_1787317 [Coprinellus micaceus]
MPCQSRLNVTRRARILEYPVYRTLTHLAIDGIVFIEDLVGASRGVSLRTALTSVRYLTLNQLTECAFTFRDASVLDTFFQSICSMNRLKRLTLSHFALPDSNHPPDVPACLADSPIPIERLNIHHTHGESLSFLFECFEPKNLSIDSCWFIRHLPDCNELTLSHIQTFDGFFGVLVGWDGRKLTFDSCPFLNELFVERLRGVMVGAEEAVWPGVNLFFHGYGYEVWRRIEEFQDLRWRLEMQ